MAKAKKKKTKPTKADKDQEAKQLKDKGVLDAQANALAGVGDDTLTNEEISNNRIALQKNFPKGV